MSGTLCLGDDQIQALPDGLGCPVAEHRFCASVPIANRARNVRHDDRVRRPIDDLVSASWRMTAALGASLQSAG
jgi:hypothetical protein